MTTLSPEERAEAIFASGRNPLEGAWCNGERINKELFIAIAAAAITEAVEAERERQTPSAKDQRSHRMSKTLEDSFIDWESSAFGFGYGTGELVVLPVLKRFFELCGGGSAGRQYDYEELE